ncbi:hypothetical protein [Streptomyces justiciae]|uniref:hypothetical protein n=1 Tax=Streptomyces justiciae TaxID=2780140 RepID=UPI00187E49FA|nr:hypothetical protein [Streptomyces justiciae]MBE8475479.1 hypothetical protein [Streptomyces justiciae]MCW8382169.1 hypothetical protein [Streptomyces justiciae]
MVADVEYVRLPTETAGTVVPAGRFRRERVPGGRPDHAVIQLCLPARNVLYGATIVGVGLDTVGERVAPPYGALIELARDRDAGRSGGYDTADRIRSWRI